MSSLIRTPDVAHTRKTEPLADALQRIITGAPPESPVDLDVVGETYSSIARRQTRELRVREFYGPVLLESDWNHPHIAHNRAKIDEVLAWQYGPRGLFVYGKGGGGKSRAVAALVWRIHVEQAIGTVLWKSHKLFAEITKLQKWGQDMAGEFIEGLTRRELLVVEDLGQEATSRGNEQLVRQWFFELLDRRMNLGLPCIITTNHTSESLAASTREISSDPLIRRLYAVGAPVGFRAPRITPPHAQ